MDYHDVFSIFNGIMLVFLPWVIEKHMATENKLSKRYFVYYSFLMFSVFAGMMMGAELMNYEGRESFHVLCFVMAPFLPLSLYLMRTHDHVAYHFTYRLFFEILLFCFWLGYLT